MDLTVAQDIAAQSPYLTRIWGTEDPHTKISCVMVKVAEGYSPQEVSQAIVDACPGVVALTTSDMISGVSDQLTVVAQICAALLGLLLVVAALALAGRFSSIASARMGELGLMRSLGMSKGASIGYLVAETGVLVLLGSVVGVAAGCVCGSFALDVVREAFAIPGTTSAAVYVASCAAGVGFALLLDGVSLASPLVKLVRRDPVENLVRGDM